MNHVRLALLVFLAGCFPEHDPEDDLPICGDGIVEWGEQCDGGSDCSAECKQLVESVVHWRSIDISSQAHSCPAGFDRASVIVQPVVLADEACRLSTSDCSLVPSAEPLVFTHDCRDGAARVTRLKTPAYEHAIHRVAVEFSNSTTGEVFGTTLETTLREVTETTMYEVQGFAHVTWAFRDTAGAARDCYQANAANVKLVFSASGLIPVEVTAPCSKLAMHTPPLAAATYTIEITTEHQTAKLENVVVGKRSAVTEASIIVPVTM